MKKLGRVLHLLLVLCLSFQFVQLPPAAAQISPFCGGQIGNGVDTAIGCIQAHDPQRFIGQILGWSVILGGGLAFLLIVVAGFQITTSAGDPKRMQAARDLLFSAISGLLLIIFSIFLLNLIGFQVLNLGSLGLSNPRP